MGHSIKLGILGYGFMGHTHAKMLKEFDDIRLMAVCDNNPEQTVDVGSSDLVIYRNSEEIIADPEINTLIISTPNQLHKDMAIQAAKAGKHIICEKPAAMDSKEFEKMVKVAEANNIIFTVHQQRRFDKDFQIVKAVMDNKMLGMPYLVKSQLYGINGNMHDWHVYKKYGGGMLLDWGVHLLDQILFMIPGKITSLYADVKNVINKEVDDYFKIILKFESGILAEIELGTYYLTPKRAWFVGGNQGSAIIEGFESEGTIVRTTRLLENVPGKITITAAGPTRSFGPPEPDVLAYEPLPEVDVNHGMFFENFINAFHGKEELLVKPKEILRVLKLIEAVHESALTSNSIAFEA